jgi:hypothetical protein
MTPQDPCSKGIEMCILGKVIALAKTIYVLGNRMDKLPMLCKTITELILDNILQCCHLELCWQTEIAEIMWPKLQLERKRGHRTFS